MYQYWLMPTGLVGTFTSLNTNGTVTSTNGAHCFWNGTLYGQTVALQGDPSMTRYDLFINTGSELLYQATFEGLVQTSAGTTSATSAAFNTPIIFLQQYMQVGQTINTAAVFKTMGNDARQFDYSGDQTAQVSLVAHYAQYTIPESGVTYNDVVEFTFNSNTGGSGGLETYWLANGFGYIRTQTNTGIGYATSFSQIGQNNAPGGTTTTVQYPTLPWYDPFQTGTNFANHSNFAYIPNGFFLTNNGVNGAVVGNSTNLPGWSQSSADCVITTNMQTPPTPQTLAQTSGPTGPWTVCLKGSSGGGSGQADSILMTAYTPVNPGVTYTLSGYVYRTNTSDTVLLDFNSGNGNGENFTDAQAFSQSVNKWEFVQATTTVAAGTTGIKIRCTRNGANIGNAYFYGITLQRTGSN